MIATRDIFCLPEPIRECIGYWGALRKLGFASDQIYLLVLPETIGVTLRTARGEFNIVVGPRPAEDPEALWHEASQALKAADESARQRLWDQSQAAANGADLVTRLVGKGLYSAGGPT